MQVHKFYEYKTHYAKDIVDGRWCWAQTMTSTWENPTPIDLLPPLKNPNSAFANLFDTVSVRPTHWKGIKWIDLFGKHPTTYFTFNETWRSYSMLPLCRRFLIFKLKHSKLQLVELDWKTNDVLVGGRFLAFKKSLGNLEETVLIDHFLYSNGDIRFLLHAVEDRLVHCLQCKVNATTRRIETIGQKFQLPREEFNFTDMRGNVLRGFLETGIITQFDLRLRQKLPSIELNDIPSNISSNTIAWSHDRLFVAKIIEDGEVEMDSTEYGKFKTTVYYSTIYNVNLESGNIITMLYKFDGSVQKMEVGLDEHFYLSTLKILPEMSAVETKYNETLGMEDHLILYQHLRIPIRQPDSLFSISVAALPRPIPLFAYKVIKKRDNVPMQLCKY